MQIDHDAITKGYAPDRYYLIEADGTRGSFIGYTQRPAAERNARSKGFGVYDTKERQLIVEPDGEKRLELIDGTIKHLQGRLTEEAQLRERVVAAMGQTTMEVG